MVITNASQLFTAEQLGYLTVGQGGHKPKYPIALALDSGNSTIGANGRVAVV